MYSIRKTKTGSGSTAVQVVTYKGKRIIVHKHIGSTKNSDEIEPLYQKAQEWIETQTKQESLFSQSKQKILYVDRSQCISITREFVKQFFQCCIDECGLSNLNSLLLDLSMMRLIEPSSKLRAIELLSYYFGINYSQRIYQKTPKLVSQKPIAEQAAYNLVTKKLKSLSIVFFTM